MNKFIIALCAFVAVVQAGNDGVDNFIKVNRAQYDRIEDGYELKLDFFTQYFNGRLESVAGQKDLMVANIVQTEDRLTPLVLLNEFTKQCVLKHRHRIVSTDVVKQNITTCQLVATNDVPKLLDAAVKVRNAFGSHIKEVFESELEKCNEHSEDYTTCISDVISDTNKFTHENQKQFEDELEAAECLAKASVKKFVDCVYEIQTAVFTKLGEFQALYSLCLLGEEECKPCGEYTCAEAKNVYGNYDSETIPNPLYGRQDNPKCLLLNVRENVKKNVK